MNIFANYPDIISYAFIPMIIAIFALGFPLLIQTITRIDDKYSSTKLIEVFRQETITNIFIWSLILSICFYIIWLLQIPPFANWGLLIDNSALILLGLSTIVLIISTFLIVHLIHIYFVPEKLTNRLIQVHNNTKNEKRKTLYFEAISKILFYSINKADEPLARTLLEFYYEAFILFRKEKEGEPIEYPQEYYDAIFEANELLCCRKKKTISYFNDSTLFHLFLDEYQKTVISPPTYNFLWKLIVQSIYHNREDFIVSYWHKAHQLFNLFMPKIYPDYDYSVSPFIVKNQTEIDKREKERQDFLEFHYALGGLLMSQHKYSTIKELMYFTQQKPPQYFLVPERMQEIIERYMQIDGEEYLNPVYYQQRYWFPNVSGGDADDIIKMWIKRYLAMLFIRQYTLHGYYTNANTLTMPNPPKELSELNRWKEELESLKCFVNDYLNQEDVLKELGLEELHNKEWFNKNKKIEPSKLIENLKKEIEDNFDKIKQEQPIAQEKKIAFEKSTLSILKPIFEKYRSLFHNNNIGREYKKHPIRGQHYILEKAAFGKNQDVGYMNFDTVTAEAVALQFQYYSTNIFILISPQKYLLPVEDIFSAINNLNVNHKDFVIISVGLYLDYFEYLHIKGLKKVGEKWFYYKMEIIEIYTNELVSQSLFILKREDLPNMIFKEIDRQDILNKFHLSKIDDKFNIYAGLNDLNKSENKTLKEELEKNSTEHDLSQKVLACVDINVEFQYKIDTKCIQLKVFSQFDDRIKPNKIDEVKSLWT